MTKAFKQSKSQKIRDEIKSLHEFYKIYGGPNHVTIYENDWQYLKKFGILQTTITHPECNMGYVDGITVRRSENRSSYQRNLH